MNWRKLGERAGRWAAWAVETWPRRLAACGAFAGVATAAHLHYASDRLVRVEHRMVVTAYCPCQVCCSWMEDAKGRAVTASGNPKFVGVTASGRKVRHGVVAADASIPFGAGVYVPGYGSGFVLDRGGAITGDHLDVFFARHKDALEWGRRELGVTLWLPLGHVLANTSS
ncbi:MAG: 3D domain-containing protein [Candidatus Hydrogenedentota bacterium]